MTAQYWVIGGEYTDTRFTTMAGGAPEQRHGPYDSQDAAREMWSGLSMASVDNCLVRFRIERESGGAFWVVGGTYTGTDFRKLAQGCAEECVGPFDEYAAALSAWRGKAWATVDDGFTRYRIEQR